MDDITSALTDFTAAFLAVAVLAVVVAGFYLGRRWFRKIDSGGGQSFSPTRNYSDYKSMRADGWTPREIHYGQRGWTD